MKVIDMSSCISRLALGMVVSGLLLDSTLATQARLMHDIQEDKAFIHMNARLPHEVLVHIFSHLGRKDLGRASTVCKDWCDASYDLQLWRALQAKDRTVEDLSLNRTGVKIYADESKIVKTIQYGPLTLVMDIELIGWRWGDYKFIDNFDPTVSHHENSTRQILVSADKLKFGMNKVYFKDVITDMGAIRARPAAINGLKHPVVDHKKAITQMVPKRYMDRDKRENSVVDLLESSTVDYLVVPTKTRHHERRGLGPWDALVCDYNNEEVVLRFFYEIVNNQKTVLIFGQTVSYKWADLLYYGWHLDEMKHFYKDTALTDGVEPSRHTAG